MKIPRGVCGELLEMERRDLEETERLAKSGELEKYVTRDTDASAGTEDVWTEYIREELGFSCSYPTDWYAQEGDREEGRLIMLINGSSTVNISHVKFESEEELEKNEGPLQLSMPECQPEPIRINGKDFKRITTRRDYPVTGGGTLNVKQTVAYRLDRDLLEGFVIVMMVPDKELEEDAERILQSIRIER